MSYCDYDEVEPIQSDFEVKMENNGWIFITNANKDYKQCYLEALSKSRVFGTVVDDM